MKEHVIIAFILNNLYFLCLLYESLSNSNFAFTVNLKLVSVYPCGAVFVIMIRANLFIYFCLFV